MSYNILEDGLPFYFEYYLPDDSSKNCILIMTPSKLKGATNIDDSAPVLIGIYHSAAGYIFRMLPSLMLITVDQLNTIISRTKPLQPKSGKILNATTGKLDTIPSSITKNVNFSSAPIEQKKKESGVDFNIAMKSAKKSIPTFNHDQKFDIFGKALKKKFDQDGNEIRSVINLIKDNKGNLQFYTNRPVKDKNGAIIIDARDGFGDPVQGLTRNMSTNEIIIPTDARDRSGEAITNVYDVFNNEIVGLTAEGGTIVNQQKMPLKIDANGNPIKQPIDIFNALIKGNYVI